MYVVESTRSSFRIIENRTQCILKVNRHARLQSLIGNKSHTRLHKLKAIFPLFTLFLYVSMYTVTWRDEQSTCDGSCHYSVYSALAFRFLFQTQQKTAKENIISQLPHYSCAWPSDQQKHHGRARKPILVVDGSWTRGDRCIQMLYHFEMFSKTNNLFEGQGQQVHIWCYSPKLYMNEHVAMNLNSTPNHSLTVMVQTLLLFFIGEV